MSVNEKLRPVLLQQFAEHLEAGMAEIIRIIVKSRHRCVCDQNIKASGAPELALQSADTPLHVLFLILEIAVAVAHGAAESGNAQPAFVYIDIILNADAALRRLDRILFVVIAVDVEQRQIGNCLNEREILCLQVTGRDNQVNVLECARFIIIPEILCLFVRHYENIHVFPTPVFS